MLVADVEVALVVAVTPMHEHALAYAVEDEQTEAYVGCEGGTAGVARYDWQSGRPYPELDARSTAGSVNVSDLIMRGASSLFTSKAVVGIAGR